MSLACDIRLRADYVHGWGTGTSAGAGMSMVLKSAGPTISRYYMSGE